MTDLDELDRLHAAATPTPWTLQGYDLAAPHSPRPSEQQLCANAEAIAALVNAWPAVSDELRDRRARMNRQSQNVGSFVSDLAKILDATGAHAPMDDDDAVFDHIVKRLDAMAAELRSLRAGSEHLDAIADLATTLETLLREQDMHPNWQTCLELARALSDALLPSSPGDAK